MPIKIRILSLGLCVALPAAAFAQAPAAPKAPGPCAQIVEACKSAGFVPGDATKGYGLWVDCVEPITNGTKPPSNTDKPLPAISPSVAAACKANRAAEAAKKGEAK